MNSTDRNHMGSGGSSSSNNNSENELIEPLLQNDVNPVEEHLLKDLTKIEQQQQQQLQYSDNNSSLLQNTLANTISNVSSSDGDDNVLPSESFSALNTIEVSRHRKVITSDAEEYEAMKRIVDKLPSMFRYQDMPEASAYLVFAIGQGIVAGSAIYFSEGIITLAGDVAGCTDDDDDCEEKVWGLLKPTSLISTIAAIVAFGGSIIMPVVGAVIDHTPHRKKIGMGLSLALIICIAASISICEETFEIMIFLFCLFGFLFQAHGITASAYLPDLAFDHDEMGKYSARFSAIEFVSIIVFFGVVLAFSWAVDVGDVGTATVSQAVATAGLIVVWTFAWKYLFTTRPELHKLPDGESMITTGFSSVFETFLEMKRDFPDLLTFWCSLALTQASTGSLFAVSTTYMDEELEMTTEEISGAYVAFLIFAIPGTAVSTWAQNALNPLRSFQVCLLLWIIVTGTACFVLRGEDMRHYIYIFTSIWGILYGWKQCAAVTVYTTIMPRGRETELMGVKSLAGGAVEWAPTLIFTIMNEQGIELYYCLSSLLIFLVLAYYVSLSIKSFEDAYATATTKSFKSRVSSTVSSSE